MNPITAQAAAVLHRFALVFTRVVAFGCLALCAAILYAHWAAGTFQ
jgi:hypothetical protein